MSHNPEPAPLPSAQGRSWASVLALTLLLSLLAFSAPRAMAGAPADFQPGVEGQEGFGPPVVSADGQQVALTRWDRAGLYRWSPGAAQGGAPQGGAPLGAPRSLQPLSQAPGAGFHPVWDGDALLWKAVPAYGVQQAIRWEAGEARLLREGPWVGQPTRLGEQGGLRLRAGRPVGPEGVDLVEPDPAGRRIAWDDDTGRLFVQDLRTGGARHIPTPEPGAHPAWSADGALLSHHTDQTITVVNPASGRVVATFEGTDPAWIPGGQRLVFTRRVTQGDLGPDPERETSPYTVISSSLWVFDAATGVSRVLLDDPTVHARYPAPIGSSGGFYFIDTRDGDLWRLVDGRAERALDAETSLPEGSAPPPPPPTEARVEVDVPYMHQLWDTPDDYNGNWSCGPTSNIQTLAKWSVLPNADITASWPYAHTSHWGWYIPNVYSFNGYTYDVWGVAAGGDTQGAHGFICREYGGAVWAYMTAFMEQHGVGSGQLGADWGALINEVNAGYPLYASVSVLGYGHIISVRGYMTVDGGAIHTMVVNDPYGDAGTGSWGNYDGADIVYDWPGYNNGHLEIGVSTLFSAHGTAPPAEEPSDGSGDGGDGSADGAADGGGDGTEPPEPDTATPTAEVPEDKAPTGNGGGGGFAETRDGRPPGEAIALDGTGTDAGCSALPQPARLLFGLSGLLLLLTRRRPRSLA